jgi:hypothetical protein
LREISLDQRRSISASPLIHATHCLHRSLSRSRRSGVLADHSISSALVRRAQEAGLDSAQLAVRACLDNFIPRHGGRRLVGLAQGWTRIRAHAALPAAIAAQRRMVGFLFPLAIARSGLRRNSRFVVGHPGNLRRILESDSARGFLAPALSHLGRLRRSAQFFDMAVERMIVFAAATRVPQ